MANNYINTNLHPDGNDSVTLYPKTVPEQIVGLNEYIQQNVPEGPVGPQGPIGPIGPQGPIGPKGDTGAQGPTGPQGGQGSQGESGPQGPIGPIGPQGPVGPQGPQGEKGDRGLIGAVGPQGPQGPQGIQGVEGPQGIRGAQGDRGPAGADGKSFTIQGQVDSINDLPTATTAYLGYAIYVGTEAPRDIYTCVEHNGVLSWENQGKLQGPQGEQGPQGIQGPQGEQGPQGIQGLQGIEGRAGNGVVGINSGSVSQGTGEYEGYTETVITVNTDEEPMPFKVYAKNGEQGEQGPQGIQGPQGERGPQGIQGNVGPQGPQGIQGIQGPVGPQGNVGPQGAPKHLYAIYTTRSSGGVYINMFALSNKDDFTYDDFIAIIGSINPSNTAHFYPAVGYATFSGDSNRYPIVYVTKSSSTSNGHNMINVFYLKDGVVTQDPLLMTYDKLTIIEVTV